MHDNVFPMFLITARTIYNMDLIVLNFQANEST